jgi:hypothetical protein
LWAYSGLAFETRINAEYSYVSGQLRHSKKLISIRGLNKDHNHDLKGLFKVCGHHGECAPPTLPGLLSGVAGERFEADDVAPDVGLLRKRCGVWIRATASAGRIGPR